MKRRIIIIAIAAALLLLAGFRYAVVERNDLLPEAVRLGWTKRTSVAAAQTAPDAARPAQPTPDRSNEGNSNESSFGEGNRNESNSNEPDTKESSAPIAGDFFVDATMQPGGDAGEQSGNPAAQPSEGADEQLANPDEQPSEGATESGEPVMRRGDRGDEVKRLQQRLRELGFLTGSADGIFGAKTEQAVIEFKRHLHALAQEELAHKQAEQEAGDEADNTAATTDPAGAVGADEANSATAINPAEVADAGEANSATAAANANDANPAEAADATEANSAPPADAPSVPAPAPEFTGEVDEATRRLLVEKGFDEYQGTLRLNARGAEVQRLQRRLRALGYLTAQADGVYGRQTARAVTAFQKRHRLTQDGIAGERTQRVLFSASAKQPVKEEPQPSRQPQKKNGKYLLKVSTKEQKVYAYAWSEQQQAYSKLARTMVCSTGLPGTPTPKGTFQSVGPVVEWGYFPKYDVWAQYLFRIKGAYLFHSVLFDEADESTVKWGSVNKLGTPASHGCIRLSVEDAKWIYRNCAAGTTVTVY